MTSGLLTIEQNTALITTINLHIDADTFTLQGQYHLVSADHLGNISDLQGMQVSFNYLLELGSVNNLIHPEDIEQVKVLLTDLQKGNNVNYHIRIITPRGDIKVLTGWGALIRVNNTEIADWDDTTAKQALQLRIFEHAEQVSKSSSWTWKLDTGEFSCSKIFYTLLGLADNQRLDFSEIAQLIHFEDRESIVNLFLLTKQRKQNIDVEFRILLPDGEVRFLRTKSDVFSTRTGVVYFIGTTQDVTTERQAELRLSEEKLQSQLARANDKYWQLLNAIDEGFCIVELILDLNNKIIDFLFLETNPAFEILTGQHDVIGKTIRELTRDGKAIWLEAFEQVFNTGNSVRFDAQTKIASDQWFEVFLFPREKNGREIAVLFTDITERRKSEQHLRDLNARLKEMDKMKTNFFSNVSHEFRTPLTLLRSPLEDLLKNNHHLMPEEIRNIQLAYKNATRLQKLVNTLLDFSRIEHGKIEAFFQPTDVCSLTTDIASNFRSIIEKAGLKFSVKTQSIAEPLYLNREMFEKIILNLISNAFKFTLQGRIEVSVRPKKKYVVITIKDTGVGISQKNLARIFERFSRVEGTKARTYEGTGIGLALVKELVQLHGGNIKVRSEENKGSEFIVSIPKGKSHLPSRQIFESKDHLGTGISIAAFIDEAASWLPQPMKRLRTTQKGTRAEQRRTIVIADDNADMREYLESILSEDYRIKAVEHGGKVLEYLQQNGEADLIISDVMMPEVDGLQLAAALKNNASFSHIPFILLSARAAEEAKIEGLEAGAENYLTKPFSARELKALVHSRIHHATALVHAHTALTARTSELEKLVMESAQQLKASETMIEKQDADLRNILNAIPQMVWVLDEGNKIRFVNERWYSYTGLTEVQCKNMDARSCEIFHPSQVKEVKDKWLYLTRERTRYVAEIMIRNHVGEYRWHLDITEPIFNDKNEVEMWVGTFTDVHEQFLSERESKETKDLLEAVFNASTNAIMAFETMFDISGAITDFKVRFYNKRSLIYYSEKDLNSKTLSQLLRQHEASQLFDQLKKVISTNIPFQTDYKTRYENHDRWFELIAVKLEDGLVITQQEITERMESRQNLIELNTSLKHKNYELKSMNEELTNFAFVSSHDLREPLRKIQLFTSEILVKDAPNLSERSVRYGERVLGAVKRMNDLIEDILTYSRIATHPKPQPVTTDLNEILNQVLVDLNEIITEKNIKVTSNRLPFFKCNPLQMTQLFYNMMSNGLKFQPGTRPVEISVMGNIVPGDTIDSAMANVNQRYLKIDFTDNGIGFEERYLEKIFGIFQRLHGRNLYPGTGMGLAICKKVVENHNGFILAKSSVGNGSVFSCYLPIPD